MYIKSSAEMRNNYRKLANLCKETAEPIYLTNNGEGELVVMSIDAYNEQRTRLRIESELLRLEAEEAAGHRQYITLDEFDKRIKGIMGRFDEDSNA
jgi:PHD/YefM family antitoxin component YafN of YafNO toxin-antitoxin module